MTRKVYLELKAYQNICVVFKFTVEFGSYLHLHYVIICEHHNKLTLLLLLLLLLPLSSTKRFFLASISKLFDFFVI